MKVHSLPLIGLLLLLSNAAAAPHGLVAPRNEWDPPGVLTSCLDDSACDKNQFCVVPQGEPNGHCRNKAMSQPWQKACLGLAVSFFVLVTGANIVSYRRKQKRDKTTSRHLDPEFQMTQADKDRNMKRYKRMLSIVELRHLQDITDLQARQMEQLKTKEPKNRKKQRQLRQQHRRQIVMEQQRINGVKERMEEDFQHVVEPGQVHAVVPHQYSLLLPPNPNQWASYAQANPAPRAPLPAVVRPVPREVKRVAPAGNAFQAVSGRPQTGKRMHVPPGAQRALPHERPPELAWVHKMSTVTENPHSVTADGVSNPVNGASKAKPSRSAIYDEALAAMRAKSHADAKVRAVAGGGGS